MDTKVALGGNRACGSAVDAPATMTGQGGHKFLSIQYLRGIAALLVVLHHIRNPIAGMFNPIAGYGFGARGVDIFFVISGFVMFTAARDEPVGTFLWRRITRVVPLYWTATLALAAILLATGKLDGEHVWSTILSLIFVPHFSLDVPGSITPLLDPGWTLNYEMFFYALFAIGIATRHVTLTTCTIIIALVSINSIDSQTSAIGITYTNPLLLEFLGGIAVAKLFYCFPSLRFEWLVFVGFVCLLSITDVYGGRIIAAGIPAIAIVAGAVSADVSGRIPNIPILKRIGDASYSIYLTHYFALRFSIILWRHIHLVGWSQFLGYSSFSFVASIMFGLWVYDHIERPILTRCKRTRAAHRAGATR